jgi:hypothetical protein
VRNYVRTLFPFLTHAPCLTLRSAQMSYRSALGPTATWLGYPFFTEFHAHVTADKEVVTAWAFYV